MKNIQSIIDAFQNKTKLPVEQEKLCQKIVEAQTALNQLPIQQAELRGRIGTLCELLAETISEEKSEKKPDESGKI